MLFLGRNNYFQCVYEATSTICTPGPFLTSFLPVPSYQYIALKTSILRVSGSFRCDGKYLGYLTFIASHTFCCLLLPHRRSGSWVTE